MARLLLLLAAAMATKEIAFETSGGEATTAQNISKAKAKKARSRSVTGELASLSDKFSTIYGEVKNKVDEEHEEQEDRLQTVEDHISRLQSAMMIEQHRRVVMLKKVEANLNQLYDKTSAECAAQIEALRPDIPERLAAWHLRLDAGFVLLAEEKIARKKVIDRERLKLLKTVDDFEKQLEIEKVERLERETLMVQKVAQETQELQETFESERVRREVTLGHERDENDQIDAMRDRPDEVFKAEMVSRMMEATKNIRMETAVRLHAEQQFVAALESYTKSLQSGLRMVNKNPPKVAYTKLIENGDEPRAPEKEWYPPEDPFAETRQRLLETGMTHDQMIKTIL